MVCVWGLSLGLGPGLGVVSGAWGLGPILGFGMARFVSLGFVVWVLALICVWMTGLGLGVVCGLDWSLLFGLGVVFGVWATLEFGFGF